jgi:predicted metal-dependent enzyme (double-stranded beta helix superfamily)
LNRARSSLTVKTMNAPDPSRLRAFVERFDALVSRARDEAAILDEGEALLAALVAQDDWLPDAFARADPDRYTQYLLHRDERERFSVVSFVWAPGQATPVHDHTVWGLVGVLRGAELSQPYEARDRGLFERGPARLLKAGEVEALSPAAGDIHKVSNALTDRPSISIHVYGADIGVVRRSVFAPDGARKPFVSGYANAVSG